MFDLKLSQFSKYLIDIGILSGIDEEQFKKQFYEISSDIYNLNDTSSYNSNINYIYFKEIISNTLVYFIKSLSEEKQKLMALNIFLKYNRKEDITKENINMLVNILNKKYLQFFFHQLKSFKTSLPNHLKRIIPSHILENISNLNNPMGQKYDFHLNENNKDNNLTNDNDNHTIIDAKKNFPKKNLKVNNSMANINPQLLNILTNTNADAQNHNNNNYNYNNSSFCENSVADNIINNYTYDKRDKQIKLIELNNTYSTNYYRPKNYFNKNTNHNNIINNNTRSMKNYMSKTSYNNKNQNQRGKFNMNLSNSNSKNNNNNKYNYNLSTSKSSKMKTKVKVDLEYLSNLSKSKTEHNLIPEKTSQYIKEQEEFNNFCTFKPKINRSSSFSGYYNISNQKSIERLYLDSKNRMARKELQALKKTNLESKENTFKPKFVSSSVKKIKTDFAQRLKDFENLKKKKIQKISTELENDHKLQYTFNPKINDSSSINKRNNSNNNNTLSNISKTSSHNQSMISKRNKIPAYKRLYDDNKDKIIRQEERIKQEMEKIKKNASKISENSSNSNYDTKKIEELYNDYKSKKKRLREKQEQIEKEQGITFRPALISEKKYYEKINPNFYEREKQFLEKQQQNIESYKLLIENEQNIKKKKYTEEEKKEIFSNIISRLYKEGVEKYIQKKKRDNNSVYNNNENEMKDSLMLTEKNKIIKNRDHHENEKVDEIEYEPEPEEEIFNPNYEIIGLNDNYEHIFQKQNINKDKDSN